MAKQLTISIENRPRRLQALPEKLDESHIDIRAFTIQNRATTACCE